MSEAITITFNAVKISELLRRKSREAVIRSVQREVRKTILNFK